MSERKRLRHEKLIEALSLGAKVNVYRRDSGSLIETSPFTLNDQGFIVDKRGRESTLPFVIGVTHEVIYPKIERWINVYPGDITKIYSTKEMADSFEGLHGGRIRCVKVVF